MGRRHSAGPQKVRQFMARLKESDSENQPKDALLEEAGRLCQALQDRPAWMETLQKAMAQSRHWGYLLTSIHVVRACVLLYLCKRQYSAACELLKSCRAKEKETLVQLWNEIHYRKMMEAWHKTSLTAVQRYRCRKRNPPPACLCPEGVKSRNYPKELRQKLQRFATEVTSNPSRKQREGLACKLNLQPHRIYNWFANYRRRRKPVTSSGLEDSNYQKSPAAQRMAGGASEDAGTEPTEEPLGTCYPGGGQTPGTQDCLSNRPFLVLQSSILQRDPLDTGAEFPSLTGTTDLAVLCLQNKPALGTGLSTTAAEPGEERADSAAAAAATILWVQSPHRDPCLCYPTWPATRRTPGAAVRAEQCSLGSADAPGVPLSPGVCVEPRPQSVSEQADREIERLVCRERQLGSLEPHSSTPSRLGSPHCCLTLPVPSLEELQGLVREQVSWDPMDDPLAIDTLWAAWLLCEFSASRQQ